MVENGQGAGRVVYRAEGGLVAKIPYVYETAIDEEKGYRNYGKNERRRIAQSIVELHAYVNCPQRLKYILCPIVDYFYIQDIPILFMPQVRVIEPKETKKFYKQKNEESGGRIDKDVSEFAALFYLKKEELIATINMGEIGGRLLLIDYGYMRDKKKMMDLPDEILEVVPCDRV